MYVYDLGGLQGVETYEKSLWSGSRFAESTKRHSLFKVFSLRKRRNQLGPIVERNSRGLDRWSHLQFQHSTYLIPFSSLSFSLQRVYKIYGFSID